MSFEAPREVGLVERASAIALKYMIKYDPERRTFVGPPFSSAAAQAELDKWNDAQKRRQMMAEREHRW